MADQTEQEPIDPWVALKRVCEWHAKLPDREFSYDHFSHDFDELLDEAKAAQVRERDAQIARLQEWNDAQRVQIDGRDAQIAILAAQVEALHEQRAESRRWKNLLELTTLRAERDAAQ